MIFQTAFRFLFVGRDSSNDELDSRQINVLIHIRRRRLNRPADRFGGNADHGNRRRHVGNDHAARTDFGVGTDADVAQYRSVRAYHHAVADFRMAVAAFLTRAAERYAVQDGNIVAQHGGFAGNETGGVVEHQPMTETGGRVNIDAEHFRHAVLQEIRQRFAAVLVKPMVDAVRLNSVETFEIQERQRIFVARGVAFVNGFQVGFDAVADARVAAQCLLVNFKQGAHVHNRAAEFAGEVVGEDGIERIVAQHGLVQKARQHRFGCGCGCGFFADGVPEIEIGCVQVVFFHIGGRLKTGWYRRILPFINDLR